MEAKQLDIVTAITETEERFHSIAPSYMKFESEKGFAVQILKNNDYLMTVARNHPQSLQQALTNVAAIGLSLNPAEKQAYLIPRTVKQGDKYVTKIFLEPSYMGFIKLATDSGSIKWVQALPVYSNDEFAFNGVGERPTHKFNPFVKPEDRGVFIGVYCVAKTIDSDYLTTMMSASDIEGIRDRSEQWKKSKSGPWLTDFIEQAKKTTIRQGFKTWPRTNLHRMAEAVSMSNENEGFEPLVTSPELGQYTAETKEYFDQLITKMDALNMFVLQCKLNDQNDSAFVNLYHSFEKGQKGKYQKIVDDLLAKGFSIVTDYRDALTQAIDSNDEMARVQLVEELTDDALEIVARGMSNDYKSLLIK
jgi:phage RecT family recombinase